MYKKLIPLLLVLLLLCSAALAEGSLVFNGDMEEQNAFGEPLGIYPRVYEDYDPDNYAVSSAYSYSGRYSLLLQSDTPKQLAYEIKVPVEPNKAYLIEGYLRADRITGEMEGKQPVGARIIVNQARKDSYDYTHTEGNWQHVEIRGLTGPYERFITLFLQMGEYNAKAKGRAYFDAIRVQEIPKEGVAEYLTNGQAELVQKRIWFERENGHHHLWILLSSLLYGLLCIAAYLTLCRFRSMPQATLWFWVCILILTALKIHFSGVIRGHDWDMETFRRWSWEVFENRSYVYQRTPFLDYPPAYLYVLYLWRLLCVSFDLSGTAELILMKLFPILVDAAVGIGIFYVAKSRKNSWKAFVYAMLYLLNPANFANTVAWGQVDVVLCAAMLLVLLLLWRNQEHYAIPVYVLAILTKPQALLFGPLALVYLLLRFLLLWRDKQSPKALLLRLLLGLGIALAAAAAIVIPFTLNQPNLNWLFELYGKTLSSYAQTSLNAYNIYYLLGLNNMSQHAQISAYFGYSYALVFFAIGVAMVGRQSGKTRFLEALRSVHSKNSMQRLAAKQHVLAYVCLFYGVGMALLTLLRPYYETFSSLNIFFAFGFLFVNFIYDGGADRLALWMGLCILMIFTMAVRMHERYLYMAVTFFLIDFIKNEKRGSFILYVLTTLTLFHNIALLLDVSTLLYPLYTMPSYYYLLNSIYSGINLLALGFGLYYAATSIYDEYENKPKQVAAHIAVPVLPSAPLQP